MLKRPFGSVRVPVIGQGTWRLRGPEAVETLRTGIELGLTHIDTAELYGTEEMVAEAVEGRRDEVFIVSKVVPSNASRAGTVRACEQSLQRLRTDRLDCYLLHWPGPHPLEDTIAAFEELQAAGKIRSYGVSNFDEDLFAEAARIAGRGRIVCNQVFYNLGERHVEARVLPTCRELGALLVGYSPFDNLPEGGELAAVAAELHATRRQVALAFLVRLPGTFAIPKASSVAHVRENAGAASLKLTEQQIAWLERAYPLHVRNELPTS
ncbi:MAG: oxidoreductase [Deltaproteobacteria bacterium 13_1_40CM_4_68_19]|nr:MAG: oxidoreductase [Deltaproteobacteria bacterium 13_1_40CM_4_68_19]OLD10630.1 MAG: oxidoreductase [Deltaproteobacteria bacterium 13_1_40CM_3_69_14]